MVIIPQQDIKLGDSVEFEGVRYIAQFHESQGKDLKDRGLTHIMYSNKGAFGMKEV